jgi:hypothetical protein
MEQKTLLSLVGKFVGADKIKNVEVSDRKTYLGNEVIKVEFEDGANREFPTEILNAVITEEMSNLTALREMSVLEPLRKIQAICLDAELKLDDVKFLLNVSFENWINSLLENITIQDINLALSKKVKKDDGK